MSVEYHYVRTVGDDGGVEVCDGPAIGLDLESVLAAGLPPWNVALEIVASMCEILDIADQDGEIHGDLGPRDIFVDDTGAVSVEGFGVDRPRTRAPEGTPRGSSTDLYGLGCVAYRLFCAEPLPELPTDDPDAHDDAVIDAVLLVDLEGVPEEMQGDIQWFLAKLMSFDREDRPSAVEAWRTFIAFADGIRGPDFVRWCSEAIEGGGERRQRGAAPKPPAPSAAAPRPANEDEDLGGPVVRTGPLAKGAISFDAGGAPKGQATAFWSKDAMKAALERAEQEEDETPGGGAFRPSVGGGSATAFWSKAQMDAMRDGKSEAPRPKRSSKRSQTMMMAKKGAAPDPAEPPGDPAPDRPPVQPAYRPAPTVAPPDFGDDAPHTKGPGGVAAPKAPPAVAVQGPRASGPRPAAPPPSLPAEPAEGGGKGMWIVGGLAVLALIAIVVCAGLGGIGGAAVLLSGAGTEGTIVEATPPAPAPAPKPAQDTDTPEAPTQAGTTPAPAPAPAPKAAPKPSPKPSPEPAPAASPRPTAPKPSSSPAPRPKPAPAPAPEPTGGPAKVAFSSSGRGSISCAGTSKEFDGPTALTIDEYQLPATCLVTIEGKRGVFQVFGTGSVKCDLSGAAVACDKASVP